MWRLEDSTPRQISAHKHYYLMENEDSTVPSINALINDDMLGYGKTLGRGLGRELAELRKINVMSDWRQTTNEAMDGQRHGGARRGEDDQTAKGECGAAGSSTNEAIDDWRHGQGALGRY